MGIKYFQYRDPNSFSDLISKRKLTYKIATVDAASGIDIDTVKLQDVPAKGDQPFADRWFMKGDWVVKKQETYIETTNLNTVYRGMSEKPDGTQVWWHVEIP